MMDDIFYYISILLPQYKCVTLPGLGAFILNKEEGAVDSASIIAPSNYTIGFNGELQHDDGVLSSYIKSVKGISYENANKELLSAIKELRKTLLYDQSVSCGTLGKLSLIEGQLLFTQNKDYIYPSHFGLTSVALATVDSIIKTEERSSKKEAFKRRLLVASTAAAAALLLLLPSDVITDGQVADYQEAGYLKSLNETKKEVVATASLPMIEEVNIDNTLTLNAVNQDEAAAVAKKKTGRTYYMILGGASSLNTANKIKEQFEADGLRNLQIVESPDRYRIYIQSFEDKTEAEQAVIQFRKDNPKYETAWIFSKRN